MVCWLIRRLILMSFRNLTEYRCLTLTWRVLINRGRNQVSMICCFLFSLFLSLSLSLFLNTMYNTSGSTIFFLLSPPSSLSPLSPSSPSLLPLPPLPRSLLAPGADITDYFNYGFSEETWKLYCDKQRKMRYEATQLSKSVVSHTLTTKKYYHSTHSNNNNNNNNNNIRMAIFVFLFQCLNVFLKLLKTRFDSLVNGHNIDYYFIHCLIWLWHKRPLLTCTSSRWL